MPGADDAANDPALAIGAAWRDIRRLRGLQTIGRDLLDDGCPPLETGELDTLAVVGAHGPCRMSELADALRVEPSTATRAVDRLERRDLVVRRKDDADGRFVEVALTAQGRVAHEELSRRRRALLHGVLEHFDDAERAQLAELLPRFAEAIADVLSRRTVDA
ncbi:MAG: MarR family transcriptional regulator [Actinomycetota bacterium]